MQKALGVAVASILLATTAIGTSASAGPRLFDRQNNFIENYCGNNWDDDCRDWDHNRDRWDESRYDRWYRDHHRHQNFGAENTAAAIFGFAAAAVGSALATGASTTHGVACEARYRSYDWQSDTYMGFDGQRHYCRL